MRTEFERQARGIGTRGRHGKKYGGKLIETGRSEQSVGGEIIRS